MVGFAWKDEDSGPVLEPGGIVVSAFPSAGLATTIAAHYMVQTLSLPRIGRLSSPEVLPVAVIQSGEVLPPIRVYGRKELAVIVSEFPPTPTQALGLATAILNGALQRKAKLVVCFEGVVPHPAEESAVAPATEDEERVWVAFSHKTSDIVKALQPTHARPLEDGVIGGVSGGLLVEAIGTAMPVAVLLVSSSVIGFPDHRAGARLIESFDRMLPELAIDTKPLRAEAEQIERALRAVLKSQAKAAEKPPETEQVTTMYQ